jgi:hypothetical protein
MNLRSKKKGDPAVKKALAAATLLVAFALAAPVLKAEHRFDFQSMKKAVKENPAYVKGQEVKWLKVLITDKRAKRDTVKITLPLVLVEAFVRCADDKHVRMHDADCDIDFQALLAELKKAGPTALIEISDDDAVLKVWLE